MMSKKMTTALNKQIGLEAKASFLYLSMAAWCDAEGLEGCARFMHRQSDEERAWYIAEQREEESLMRSILDKIKLIGSSPMSLYYIDKEIDAINTAEMKKEASGE